jgi:hypothetical protein
VGIPGDKNISILKFKMRHALNTNFTNPSVLKLKTILSFENKDFLPCYPWKNRRGHYQVSVSLFKKIILE